MVQHLSSLIGQEKEKKKKLSTLSNIDASSSTIHALSQWSNVVPWLDISSCIRLAYYFLFSNDELSTHFV